MSVDYRVLIHYDVDDRASPALHKIAGAGDIAGASLGAVSSMAGSLGGMLDAAASKVFTLTAALAAVAGAGAIAAIKDGIVGVNAELESSALAIASSLNILGGADSFSDGLDKAKDLVADIKKDSASLPGEFQDFVGIAQTLTPALTNAGQGITKIRSLTRDTAVAAASVGVGFDQAGREMSQLLSGLAGAHNVLGMRLGITKDTKITDDTGTHSFKDASTISRLEFIEKTLSKAKDALPAFSDSFGGLASTLKDTVRGLFGEATLGLFERVKGLMKDMISELDSPRAHAFAHEVGEKLVEAFDWLVAKTRWLGEHWTEIRDTAVSFGEQIRDAFVQAWPIIQKIGEFIGEKMKDPGGSLKELAEARLGLGLVEKAPSIVNTISGLAGGGGGAGGLAAGGEGLAAAAGPAIVALIALAGAVDVVTQKEGTLGPQMQGIVDAGKGMWTDIKEKFGGTLSDLGKGLGDLFNALRPLIDILGVGLLAVIDVMVTEMEIVAGAFKTVAGALNDFMVFLGLAKEKTMTAEQYALLGKTATGATIIQSTGDAERQADLAAITDSYAKQVASAPKIRDDIHQAYFDQFGQEMDDAEEKKTQSAASSLMKAASKSNELTGKGTTNITVTAPVTVLSESDPERFAVAFSGHLEKVLRFPTKSLGAPTFRME